MTAARGQTSHPPPVDKIVPDHLVFKRMFTVPAKGTLPFIGFANGKDLRPFRFPTGDQLSPTRFTAGDNLGFFCKKELMIQRALRIPIFFRLGSLEYCNKLEGK